MTRSEELDAMTEADKEADILKTIKDHGIVRIEGRQALAFWGGAIDSLKKAGKVEHELVENYEGQYSYIKVTFPKGQKMPPLPPLNKRLPGSVV